MAVAKITGQGLAAMALLVALLWSCFVGEWLIVRHANREISHVLRQNRIMQMKRNTQPVRVPVPKPRLRRPEVG